MAHAIARLTQFGRLLLVQRITELGWPPAQAAESLGVSRATAYKWLARYRQHGQAGLADRSSRPYHCPHALSAAQVRRVLAARRRYRQGPHRLAFRLHMARSTIYGVLARHHMSRLAHTDRASGVVVRYQRQHPGELVHLDVKKLGRIPDGGGHRAHGRAAARPGRGIGYDYLHSTAGPDRQRQGLCRVGPVHRDRRHPVEWFNKTLLEEWAYARLYRSNTERRRAFTRWLRTYNHRRPHTALDGLTPMAVLVNNVHGKHT
jgi:transposase